MKLTENNMTKRLQSSMSFLITIFLPYCICQFYITETKYTLKLKIDELLHGINKI